MRESLANQVINWVLIGGDLWPHWGNEGPMHIIRGPFVDPATDQFALLLGKWLTVIGWRHHHVRVIRFDPENRLALVSAAGDDGNLRFAPDNSPVAKIQSQIGFATAMILPVADNAFLGKDRLDLESKVDRGLSAKLGAE